MGESHHIAWLRPSRAFKGTRRGAIALARLFRPPLIVMLACFQIFSSDFSLAQQAIGHSPQSPPGAAAAAAGQIADFFGEVGDQIYEDCIFELSQEQIEIQQALIVAYIKAGANAAMARKLAVKQIHPPKLSAKCEQIRNLPKRQPGALADVAPADAASPGEEKRAAPVVPKSIVKIPVGPPISIANKRTLPQWDCAAGVDYVTIQLNGYPRKLTGGEICNPFEDVIHEISPAATKFRLGYTIRTGRLFIVSSDPSVNGQTIAWAISGREMCRNNPDPDCFATRAVGPLPPGEYAFGSATPDQRITWGPKTKRNVAGIYLTKLWNRDKFSQRQTAAILARGNIAIHERLKGEMSEACLGLEAKGWAYVASLIKSGRANGLNAYIDEPYPQVAENPPIVVASSFSLTSLFK
jgi:hypothetical protein